METYLEDIEVDLISILEWPAQPANGKPLVFKSTDDKVEIKPIIKSFDEELGILYVTVMAAGEKDSDDEIVVAKEIRKAAHAFMKNGTLNRIDKDHNLIVNKNVIVVESHIAETGNWEAAFDISADSELCQKAKEKKLTGVSIFGRAKQVRKAKENIKEDEEARNFVWSAAFDKLSGLIEKLNFKNVTKKEEKSDMKEAEIISMLEAKYGFTPKKKEDEGDNTEDEETGEAKKNKSHDGYVKKEAYDTVVKTVEKLAAQVETLAKTRNTTDSDSGETISFATLLKSADKMEKFQAEHPDKYQELKAEFYNG